MGKPVSAIAGLLALGITLTTACKKNEAPTGELEKRYAAMGDYAAVTNLEITTGTSYSIHYPQPLTGNHPVVVWGNGTGAQPSNYEGIFKHLASWGFVVIDSYSKNTGTGAEILAAAEYLQAENNRAGSPFYQQLDEQHFGAVGHSQGAAGVLNAHTDFSGGSIFRTVVPIALPAPKWTNSEHTYNTGDLNASLFLMSGGSDGLISPVKSNVEAFDRAPAPVPAVMAIAIATGHNAITENGGKHRGYLTAWLRYQLAGDNEARKAFTEEISQNNSWKEVRTRNLN